MADAPNATPPSPDEDRPVSLDEVLAIAAEFRGFDRPWWVAGGWAIDLFVGQVTRPHADLEVGVWRDDQLALRALWPDRNWQRAVDGEWLPWAGEPVELPVFQLRARRPGAGADVEFFLNDRAADGTFVCRRDDRVRVEPDRLVVPSPLGIPALAPEVQLLYKAKYVRPKDEQDLATAAPAMSADRRRWLADALAVVHPGHAWIARLVPPRESGRASEG